MRGSGAIFIRVRAARFHPPGSLQTLCLTTFLFIAFAALWGGPQLVKKLACGDFFDDFCTVCL